VYFELEKCTWRQHFFTNALRKNSCIGKNYRNDVQKFTPTNILRGNLEFPVEEFPPAIYLVETLQRGWEKFGISD